MRRLSFAAAAIAALLVSAAALADPARDAILAAFADQAKSADAAFAGFSTDRGRAFWTATHSGGKPDTPSCTTCHGADPKAAGQTRAGQSIAPMAISVTPDRFTDPEKVAKWFLRNCNSVLGRECTAAEKGDVITYLSSQ